MKNLILVFAVIIFGFTACHSNKEGIAISFSETPEAKVAKTIINIEEDTSLIPLKLIGKWELKSVLKDKVTIKPEQLYYIEFLKDGISFNLDCNNCFTSKVEISKTTINIGPAACTKKACQGDFNQLKKELRYIGTYTVNDSIFTILSDKGSTIAFKKISVK